MILKIPVSANKRETKKSISVNLRPFAVDKRRSENAIILYLFHSYSKWLVQSRGKTSIIGWCIIAEVPHDTKCVMGRFVSWDTYSVFINFLSAFSYHEFKISLNTSPSFHNPDPHHQPTTSFQNIVLKPGDYIP